MRLDYKKSDIYKRLNFLTESPTLSGEEEVVARAGENLEDPWAKENQNPGLYGVHRIDEKGRITEEYQKLLEGLHMELKTIKPFHYPEPSEENEERNLRWRKIQEEKKHDRVQSTKRIEERWIVSDNKKQEHLDMLRAEASFRKTLDKKLKEKK